MKLNLLTSEIFPDKEICKNCKHYKERIIYDVNTQVLDAFCCGCYSDKVFIVTRFEKKEEAIK